MTDELNKDNEWLKHLQNEKYTWENFCRDFEKEERQSKLFSLLKYWIRKTMGKSKTKQVQKSEPDARFISQNQRMAILRSKRN